MSDMLKAIKADLLSRPMLPLLILVCAALVAAVGYGVLGGSAKSAPKTLAAPISAPEVPGPAVASAPPNPNAALAETTSGASFQHGGKMRNPFQPLPGAGQGSGTQSATGPSSGAGSGTVPSGAGNGTATSGAGTAPGSQGSPAPSGSSGNGGSQGGAGGNASPPAPAGSNPAASPGPAATTVTVYDVSVTLAQLSQDGKPAGKPQTFTDIQTLTPLPGQGEPLLAPYLAGKGGKSMIFLLLRAPILHGEATCLPSAGDCLAIQVPLHGSEQLSYLSSKDTVSTYRLTVTAMQPHTISLSAQKAKEAQSKGLAIIKQRAVRLQKALAHASTAAAHR